MLVASSLTLFALVTAHERTNDSGAAEAGTSSADVERSGKRQPRVSAPERCPDAHAAVRYYRGRLVAHRDERNVTTERPLGRDPRSCPDARHLARLWQTRAFRERKATERFWRTIQSDSRTAILYVFGPLYGPQALRVASCESGWSMTPRAHNGQYLGMFQMGNYARSAFGHGNDRLTQARAAYRYFVASGRDWSPWSCKP